LTRLRTERRKLAAQLAQVDKQISKLAPSQTESPSLSDFDRWIDELSSGLENLPPLPADFSRADIYDDHD
jgi:hypothetical protein